MTQNVSARRILLAFILLVTIVPVFAADPASHRVLDVGQQPDDRRLQPPKDLNGYFPFEVPETKTEWLQRQAELRQRVLVATGLYPMPEKTPLNAVIHGKVLRDGFTVEKVYFESLPGHFVSGLLFRPEGKVAPATIQPYLDAMKKAGMLKVDMTAEDVVFTDF